ncbi:hypothetical protein [Actinomadura parmotrematis]|uniref:PH domain-containing protein n=1 Tax=Actinomadura parmotrematis TaxID=2864039 RepID=A0ABS7G6W6_9ACTN|nr:hypothetical protein [Actinomadura parmotrematis]MBW8487373.1 hypothetical protein [Actinomadura parmotrematis]
MSSPDDDPAGVSAPLTATPVTIRSNRSILGACVWVVLAVFWARAMLGFADDGTGASSAEFARSVFTALCYPAPALAAALVWVRSAVVLTDAGVRFRGRLRDCFVPWHAVRDVQDFTSVTLSYQDADGAEAEARTSVFAHGSGAAGRRERLAEEIRRARLVRAAGPSSLQPRRRWAPVPVAVMSVGLLASVAGYAAAVTG